jgi:hypothetical protein
LECVNKKKRDKTEHAESDKPNKRKRDEETTQGMNGMIDDADKKRKRH